jgi:sRNA-binding carbon storage regulator CsrA
MLFLTRKPGEEVVLTVPPSAGETTIRVLVSNVTRQDRRVQLAFDAPREVAIFRTEILPPAEEGPADAQG